MLALPNYVIGEEQIVATQGFMEEAEKINLENKLE
jgi:hypothetical protein